MTGNTHQHDNVENFVRENTRMIVKHSVEKPNPAGHRLYKCKDCDKEYDSFQALGGHRASHRAPKQETKTDNSAVETRSELKLHQCKICNKGFEIGQSLGGHMRKHWRRKVKNADIMPAVMPEDSSSSSSSSIPSCSNGEVVFKYDLNLTPQENESIHQDSSLTSS
ncbi:hypothetical protein SSX86_028894 [Deinandra increscens subsp. villosa]|uniref:C2H2-type domain-containing protein n=1 Tax=Deinandra increscens subsp. villosa TaxID=3103831 RepID=A0AAP0CA99_9ASTR